MTIIVQRSTQFKLDIEILTFYQLAWQVRIGNIEDVSCFDHN